MIKNQYSNQPPFPRVLRIEPASQCNLACSHCPTSTIDMKRGLMTDDIFNKILSEIELHKNDIKAVVLYHGGEPNVCNIDARQFLIQLIMFSDHQLLFGFLASCSKRSSSKSSLVEFFRESLTLLLFYFLCNHAM